jgi:hypothetical protein
VVSRDLSSDPGQAGISSIELGRRRGTQTTAWKVKHKLNQVMLECDATKRLAGRVEIDDAHLGVSAPAASRVEGLLARRRLSSRSRRPPKESRFD